MATAVPPPPAPGATTPGAVAVPKIPRPVGGALPFMGPYQQNQLAAEQAYQNAIAQLNSNYGQSLQSYGFMPQGSSIGVDPSNQFGAYQQMLRASADESHGAEASAMAHGFNPSAAGFGHQGVDQAQLDAGGRNAQLSQAMEQMIQQYQMGLSSSKSALTSALQKNKMAEIEAAIKAGAFTPAKMPTSKKAALVATANRMAQLRKDIHGGKGNTVHELQILNQLRKSKGRPAIKGV